MIPFNPGDVVGANLSALWRKYVKEAEAVSRKTSGISTTMQISPSQVICGRKVSLKLTFETESPLQSGGFIVFDLPQGWGGWKSEQDTSLLQKSGGTRAYLKGTKESLVTRVISRGSRLSIIEVLLPESGNDLASGVVVQLPPLLPCDRPGRYGFHAFWGGLEWGFEQIASEELTVVAGSFNGFDLLYPSSVDPGQEIIVRLRARAGAESSYFSCCESGTDVEFLWSGIDDAQFVAVSLPVEEDLSEADAGLREGTESPEETGDSVPIRGLYLKEKVGTVQIRFESGNGSRQHQRGHPVVSSQLLDGMKVFFGDLHVHTEKSDGIGSAAEAYCWALEGAGLDFLALNDHVEDRLTYQTPWNESAWSELLNEAWSHSHPGRFVAIPGVEICGAVNLYFNDYDFPFFPLHTLDGDVDGTGRFLQKVSEDSRVLFGYHKLSQLGEHYLDYPVPRLLEIIQHKREPELGVERFLPGCDSPPSFLGATDSHCGLAASPPMGFTRDEAQYGLTGVVAEALTMEALFTSLAAGRTFATSGQKSIALLKVNGVPMGGTVQIAHRQTELEVAIQVWACSRIEKLELMCNGRLVKEKEVSGNRFGGGLKIPWTPLRESFGNNHIPFCRCHIYLRVTEETGMRIWSSPVLVLGEQI
ncbi:MAG: hypothetical protein KAJ98_10160 [Spirochaetaceae bacterium]|nr:hypothetical protein [Spirochaetaceae bacterium]